MKRELNIPVGKRRIDDRKTVEIAGTLITPERRSETLVLFLCGTSGHHEHYVEHFGALIGQEFNVCVAELRNRGLCRDTYLADDVAQVDAFLRDMTEAENVVYAGHSTGMGVAAAAKNKQGTDVVGLYGISAFPSVGDSRTSDRDITKRSLQQTITDAMAGSRFGPFACPLKESSIDEPVRFVIPGDDKALKTDDLEVALRFMTFFDSYADSSSIVVPMRNHCFNYGHKDYVPFNKDDPKVLVYDFVDFVNCVSAGNRQK